MSIFLRPEPLPLLCSLLIAWSVYLLVTAQPLGKPQPDLDEQLRKLDPWEHSDRGDTRIQREAIFSNRLLEALLRPMLDDVGYLIGKLFARFGLGTGRDLERELALVKPDVSVSSFYGQKFFSGLIGLSLFPLMNYLGVYLPGMRVWPVWIWLAGFCIGFGWPDWSLRQALKERRTEMLLELPLLLDMIGICVSAGQAPEQALREVAGESHGLVAEELRRASGEMMLAPGGPSLSYALEAMARRNALPELTLFVARLKSSMDLGFALSDTLAVQSDALREAKRLRILEAGGKAGVKMVFPIALILPVLFVVLLLPAVLQLLGLGL
ncbi:MAG: type II secretion system F family protein [Chloroflexota bacterium]|nr:type II secretion system F family protein [Chloroflexota bacterium]